MDKLSLRNKVETEKIKPESKMSEVKNMNSFLKDKEDSNSLLLRIATAVFYGLSSFMIMVINKRVLTVYHFPSFQGKINK